MIPFFNNHLMVIFLNGFYFLEQFQVYVHSVFIQRFLSFLFKGFIYLFLKRGEEREKESERNINVRLSLLHPLPGTWPATQAYALTGNPTSDPLVCKPALSPLYHTNQGENLIFNDCFMSYQWMYYCLLNPYPTDGHLICF